MPPRQPIVVLHIHAAFPSQIKLASACSCKRVVIVVVVTPSYSPPRLRGCNMADDENQRRHDLNWGT